MNGFDLSGLAPEELQQLTIHAIQTSQECSDAINQMTQVIQYLMSKVSDQDEHINKLDDVVMNEIVGGVNQLYEKNQHDSGYDSIKQQYGSLFEPHMGSLSEMYPDADLYEELLKEKSNYPDEGAFGGRVNDIASALQAKLDRIRGTSSPATAPGDEGMTGLNTESVTPDGGAAAMPAGPGTEGTDAVIAMVRKMKGRKSPLSLS